MTVANTDRFDLTTWSSGDDEFTREQMTASHESIEDRGALFLTSGSAPSTTNATNTKAFFWDHTNGKLYFRGDTLSAAPHAWQQIYPVLQTEALKADLQPLDSDLTAVAGLSTTGIIVRTGAGTAATRSIATSGTGLSISNADGVANNMTITLASSTSATVDTVVLREASGRITVGEPTSNSHAATKLYVDTADNLKANTADVYSKTDIHGAKLYQYANEAGGTGAALPSSGTRTTPRIYVQSTEPSSVGAITGDIWFQI